VPLLAVLLVLLVAAPGAEAGAPWRAPLEPLTVLRGYRFDPGAPFVAGRRRGVLLGGHPGAPVRAPCAGRVRFAGAVPRLGRGVTLVCGPRAATVFGLCTPGPRPGATVSRGAVIGRLAAGGRLWLAARRAGARHGYADPLALIGRDRGPLGPAPAARRERRPEAPPTGRVPAAAPGAPALAPGLAWLGLAVAGAAAGAGIRRRRPPAARPTSVEPACRARPSTSRRPSTT
jgi:hypothetical protein